MPEIQLQIQVPDDMQGGTYANVVNVWHSPYEFTFDFLVTQPVVADEDGNPVLPARVVSRIKLPPGQIFELMKAMNTQLANYEAQIGPIQHPGQDKIPPDEPMTT